MNFHLFIYFYYELIVFSVCIFKFYYFLNIFTCTGEE